MSEERIIGLLKDLLVEVEQAPDLDDEALHLVQKLEADIRDLINPEVVTDDNSVLDDAIALETSFAARHPVSERIIRELIDSLNKIGI